MKKLLLVGILVISGLSFARDFEYREAQEFKSVENIGEVGNNMMSRENKVITMNTSSDFHRDLDNMSRGSDRN